MACPHMQTEPLHRPTLEHNRSRCMRVDLLRRHAPEHNTLLCATLHWPGRTKPKLSQRKAARAVEAVCVAKHKSQRKHSERPNTLSFCPNLLRKNSTLHGCHLCFAL